MLLFRCNVVINFFKNAYRVGVVDDHCEICGANILDVDFNKVSSYYSHQIQYEIPPFLLDVQLSFHKVLM